MLLLHDGRPGHSRQARALAGYLPARALSVNARTRAPWRTFAPRKLPFGLAAHSDLRRSLPFHAPRAVVSCGRKSALVARWLQHHWSPPVKTVQILDCGLDPGAFTWVVAPRHDGLRGRNVLTTVGSLNPVDEDWLASAAGRRPEGAGLPEPRIGLLLGGPSKHLSFGESWLKDLVAFVAHTAGRRGGSLIAVMSPRTPAWAADELRRRTEPLAGKIVPWPAEETEYAAALAHATHLVVTADSVNLQSEACATGKPVFVAGSRDVQGRPRKFCNYLLRNSYLLPLEALERSFPEVRSTRVLRETGAVAERLVASGLLD